MRALAAICLSTVLTGLINPAWAAEPASSPIVRLTQDHVSDWRIICPPPASPAINWAASELQRYLRQMSGCRLPIASRTRGKPALAIGIRPELSPDYRAALPPCAKGYDGYAVAVVPGTRKTPACIVIAGDNSRGVIYGVYDLLKRLGCRWSDPTQEAAPSETVPQRATLSLPAGSWAVASPDAYRICKRSEWFSGMRTASALQQFDRAMKARYNGIGWQADTRTPIETQYQQLADSGLLAELARRDLLVEANSSPGTATNLPASPSEGH